MNIIKYHYRPEDWFDDLVDPLRTMPRWTQWDARDMDVFPRLQGWFKPDEAVIQADLPGVDPDKIDVNISEKTLTLSGTREVEPPVEGGAVALNERRTGAFKRSIELPYPVDADKIKATHKYGVLTIRLPRVVSEKTRQIKIEAA